MMNTILHVRQNSTDFFVLAEKNYLMPNNKFIDSSTKQAFSAEELSYALTQLKDGKPKTFIGYVSSIEEKTPYLLRIPTKKRATSNTKEFKSTILFIIEKVYDVE